MVDTGVVNPRLHRPSLLGQVLLSYIVLPLTASGHKINWSNQLAEFNSLASQVCVCFSATIWSRSSSGSRTNMRTYVATISTTENLPEVFVGSSTRECFSLSRSGPQAIIYSAIAILNAVFVKQRACTSFIVVKAMCS